MRVLICGIPNVGKSTLINTLSRKTQAKTGDEAGITKQEQRIVLDDDFYLWDTPGMLWRASSRPRAVCAWPPAAPWGRNAYDEEEVLEPLAYLRQHYAPLIDARSVGPDAEAITARHDEELLERSRKARRRDERRPPEHAKGRRDRAHWRPARRGAAPWSRLTLETVPEFDLCPWLVGRRPAE